MTCQDPRFMALRYYGRKLACARKHGSCLYSPLVDTQALNFRDADHKTENRDHKLDR